ncbi:hypothetical protein [Aureispira sp. CCB-E]|uniref:hypothetical protein n=1 Tax=Aureispira sp. CCB-E TaxID=3051121 RepID=UPI002868C9BA|nr:hypothetical protein [Aureispira sp. CCB-E]WMX17547.1 hypothetical protein QP953_28425 [Aureispira sp. CCB-E]
MKKTWYKMTPYIIGISLFGSGSAFAWELGWIELIIQHFWYEIPISHKEKTPLISDSSTIILDTPNDSIKLSPENLIEWIESEEDDLYTSKMTNNNYSAKEKNQKPSGNRIGCICMDNDRQNRQGTGACSGHGGVRFWLHQQENGLILEYPTSHHKRHPAPLSYDELSKLASFKRKQKEKNTNSNQSTFLDMLMLFIVCLTIAYIAKLWWEKSST